VDTIAAPGSVDSAEYAAAMDHLASVWNEASTIAAASQVRVAWEFEPGFLFNKPTEVVDLYEQVGHPNFQILFDTCHAYVCGVVGERQHGKPETLPTVAAFLDKLAGRVGHIHLTDSDGTLCGDETSRHVPLGQGSIRFDLLAPKLGVLPGVDWWCVDLAFWPGAWELVESSLEFLKRLEAVK
jgi:sugar phosphate isomerase/epimerase